MSSEKAAKKAGTKMIPEGIYGFLAGLEDSRLYAPHCLVSKAVSEGVIDARDDTQRRWFLFRLIHFVTHPLFTREDGTLTIGMLPRPIHCWYGWRWKRVLRSLVSILASCHGVAM